LTAINIAKLSELRGAEINAPYKPLGRLIKINAAAGAHSKIFPNFGSALPFRIEALSGRRKSIGELKRASHPNGGKHEVIRP
jgi:hypothetical protein